MPLWLSDPVYAVPRRRRVVLTSTPIIWYAHYDTTTGELLSVGTVVPDPLPGGTDVVVLSDPPSSLVIWDTTLRNFVLRDPPLLVDRVLDLVGDASLAGVWAALDTTQQDALKSRIGQLLGPYRMRFDFQPVDLEAGHPEIGD